MSMKFQMHIEMLLSVPCFYLVILYQFVAKYRADIYLLLFIMQWMKKIFTITNMYLNEKEI